MNQAPYWRVAGAAVVFVLAGSSAVLLAGHDRPSGSAVTYRSWPQPSPAHRIVAARRSDSARTGAQLMSQAAAACQTTAFSGIQVSRWWGLAGSRVSRA